MHPVDSGYVPRMRARLLVLAAGLLIVPSTAEAGTWDRRCGHASYTENGLAFHSRLPDGAGIFHIRTQVSRCLGARRLVRAASRYPGPCNSDTGTVSPCRARGYVCRYTRLGHEYSRMRCTREGGRVVAWNSGA